MAEGRREGKKVGNAEGLTKERRRKSDIEERSCKWEGTTKKGRTRTQFGYKSKYEKRKKRIKAGLKEKYGREVEFK